MPCFVEIQYSEGKGNQRFEVRMKQLSGEEKFLKRQQWQKIGLITNLITSIITVIARFAKQRSGELNFGKKNEKSIFVYCSLLLH